MAFGSSERSRPRLRLIRFDEAPRPVLLEPRPCPRPRLAWDRIGWWLAAAAASLVAWGCLALLLRAAGVL